MPGSPPSPALPDPGSGEREPAPTSTSAASAGRSPDARHASISTASPFSRAGRPTNRTFVAAVLGHDGLLGGATAGALQKSLSTDCGATCTLRAPRARTYRLTCGPYVTTASADR